MDVGRYRHNNEGFYKKIIIPNVFKSRFPCKPCENYLLSSLSQLMKSIEEEIQPYGDYLDTVRG